MCKPKDNPNGKERWHFWGTTDQGVILHNKEYTIYNCTNILKNKESCPVHSIGMEGITFPSKKQLEEYVVDKGGIIVSVTDLPSIKQRKNESDQKKMLLEMNVSTKVSTKELGAKNPFPF